MRQLILEYSAPAQKIVQEKVLRFLDYKKRDLGSFRPAAGIPRGLFIMKKEREELEEQDRLPPAPGQEAEQAPDGEDLEEENDFSGGHIHPVLRRAEKILSDYVKATGVMACVHDHTCMPVQEIFEKINKSPNNCGCCLKYRTRGDQQRSAGDLSANPCAELHINAIREAHRSGGSNIYMCDMGFMFWTSPLYGEGRFIGALSAGGILGIDREESAAEMNRIFRGYLTIENIEEHLALFAQGAPEKIRSLAELLFICAGALSSGTGRYHETLKRRAEQQAELSGEIMELKEKYPPGTPEPSYPLEKERMLLAALRRGDNNNGKKILNELLAVLLFSNPGEFKYIQFRAIELVVLLSRADANPASTEKGMLETNNKYLKQIQEARDIEELADVLHHIVNRIAAQIFSFKGIRHAAALRKAEHFIWENFTRKISLQEIAEVSGLSAPYFSTIFKEEMGENLSSYLNRLRVEKAAAMLTGTKLSLSEIAGSCGFEDQSWFSKIFKHYSGVSPGKYRGQGKTGLEIPDTSFSARYRGVVTNKERL